jgi:hypothetical protein
MGLKARVWGESQRSDRQLAGSGFRRRTRRRDPLTDVRGWAEGRGDAFGRCSQALGVGSRISLPHGRGSVARVDAD